MPSSLNALEGLPLRYVEHEFYGSVVDYRAIAPPPPSPYAVVMVESPEHEEPVVIQVAHKLDFYNLWILDKRKLLIHPDQQEIIIRYKPATGLKRLLKSILPVLEYSLYERGHFEKLCDPVSGALFEDEDPHLCLHGLKRFVNYPLCTLIELDEPLLR